MVEQNKSLFQRLNVWVKKKPTLTEKKDDIKF
jgi:hypothetical protein